MSTSPIAINNRHIHGHYWVLLSILVLFAVSSGWQIGWGLFDTQREAMLFPQGSEWSRERVAEVRQETTAEKIAEHLGADVDPNPTQATHQPRWLNETPTSQAEIFSRFLLYSAQPDEMITFRALGQMAPARWKLDPKMYQYGGMFVYPVGVLAKISSSIGAVPSRRYKLLSAKSQRTSPNCIF